MRARNTLLPIVVCTVALRGLGFGLAFATLAPEEEVRWVVGGVEVVGTLHLPAGDGPFRAVVFVPGSGNLGRGDAIPRAHAQRLTAIGFAVLTYDKRGVGESGGNWRQQSLSELAEDVRGALALLRSDPRIDDRQIGLIGHSQGGWIAPLAAVENNAVDFVVLVASTPLSPLEQGLYVTDVELRERGVGDAERQEALGLLRRIFKVYATDSGWDETRATIDAARGEPWFDDELFALQPADSWNWRWLRRLPFAFDVTPTLERMAVPLLTINGGNDAIVPAERSRELFESVRGRAGLPLTAIVVPGLNHRMGEGDARVPADAYWRVLTDWLRKIPDFPGPE